MKKSLGIVGVFAALLLLPACSPNTQPSPGESEHSTASSPMLTTPPATPTAPSSSAAAASGPPAADSPLPLLDLNQRGNVVQQVGQTSTFGATTGQKFADMTAKQIQTNFKCTSPTAQPSANGQFVALTIAVTVFANFAESGWPTLEMTGSNFKAWDSSGVRLPDPIGNSADCVPAKDLLSSPNGPGESATGLVILDVPTGPGYAAFVVGGFEGSYGWEWHW